ncbi:MULTISPECIES: bi-domain-containing oxidoreductase [unclassified Paenibacillus]|uniref:bi-domain-containing oxidoreductase n=1 Tax=unclassified Paenibacillus TaxID=185978 RepID=UPI00020D71E0|nr:MULTISPECIES: bi-domain-containing oxidoreductase [unclassified Paenibacillus]EGL19528.1 GroES-like protein [Paenibacillus sp. HGF7]EPD82532.1 hypothetical protein HMPREF1207_03324 [Paenibacillus sp. HGH0039]
MNQILQNLKTGATEIADIPCPQVRTGHLLIQTRMSVVSAGTERMLVEFGKANLLEKAKQQPDKVKQVMDKIKTDGLAPTLEAVRTKLDQPLALGYSNVGTVVEVGRGVEGFAVGDRVISNGPHAEIVHVPKQLCAKIPDGVDDEEAAFTVIASIGLQGIRLANPTLGETFVVTGLGLIGLITVQLLRAHGCRVLGADFDPGKLQIAKSLGAEIVDLSKGEDPLSAARTFSKGRGVDGVLITASTKSSEPVHQAAHMCRKRGRIVLVGVTGLELSRADFYEKELSFQVSCSYGPGRYDPEYEEKGQDYPVGFVRWTEQRNFEAILDMLADGKLDLKSLITHRFPIGQAVEAYEVLGQGKSSLGIILHYDPKQNVQALLNRKTVELALAPADEARTGEASVGIIGAGNYTNQVLLPALKQTKASLHTIASSGGVNGLHVGRRHGFVQTTTDTGAMLADPAINTIFVTTRHNTHARYAEEAIKAGKHVFVEKPLCLNRNELQDIKNLRLQPKQILMVGFNRRFSPFTVKMKQLLDTVKEPKTLIMTVNAGDIPAEHWTQDPEVGGGRIIGEACHFVDTLRFLVGHPITEVTSHTVGRQPGVKIIEDKATITLRFEDGSLGTVHYFANGHKSFPKERIEVFAAGKILEMNNFKELRGYGWNGFTKMKLWSQDKGHKQEMKAFVDAVVTGSGSPIPLSEIYEVTEACLDIVEQLREQERQQQRRQAEYA